MATVVGLEAIGQGRIPLEIDETVAALATTVLSMASGHVAAPLWASARDERRIADVVRYMDEQANEPHTLGGLAGMAASADSTSCDCSGRRSECIPTNTY